MDRRGFLLVGLAAGLTGCVGSKTAPIQGRSQIGEDAIAELDSLSTVGAKTQVGNTDAIPVSGVGLVLRPTITREVRTALPSRIYATLCSAALTIT